MRRVVEHAAAVRPPDHEVVDLISQQLADDDAKLLLRRDVVRHCRPLRKLRAVQLHLIAVVRVQFTADAHPIGQAHDRPRRLLSRLPRVGAALHHQVTDDVGDQVAIRRELDQRFEGNRRRARVGVPVPVILIILAPMGAGRAERRRVDQIGEQHVAARGIGRVDQVESQGEEGFGVSAETAAALVERRRPRHVGSAGPRQRVEQERLPVQLPRRCIQPRRDKAAA